MSLFITFKNSPAETLGRVIMSSTEESSLATTPENQKVEKTEDLSSNKTTGVRKSNLFHWTEQDASDIEVVEESFLPGTPFKNLLVGFLKHPIGHPKIYPFFWILNCCFNSLISLQEYQKLLQWSGNFWKPKSAKSRRAFLLQNIRWSILTVWGLK